MVKHGGASGLFGVVCSWSILWSTAFGAVVDAGLKWAHWLRQLFVVGGLLSRLEWRLKGGVDLVEKAAQSVLWKESGIRHFVVLRGLGPGLVFCGVFSLLLVDFLNSSDAMLFLLPKLLLLSSLCFYFLNSLLLNCSIFSCGVHGIL